jgi:hypothetical protein
MAIATSIANNALPAQRKAKDEPMSVGVALLCC